MPQGKSKLNAAKQSSGGKKKVADKKKGLRAIPPKKTVTVRQATQHKVSWRFWGCFSLAGPDGGLGDRD